MALLDFFRRIRRKKEPGLSAHDFFMANCPDFLKRHPDVREKLISEMKDDPLDDCLCCVFFKWVEKDGKIEGPSCAACTDIPFESFKYGSVPDECPVRKEDGHG